MPQETAAVTRGKCGGGGKPPVISPPRDDFQRLPVVKRAGLITRNGYFIMLFVNRLPDLREQLKQLPSQLDVTIIGSQLLPFIL